MDFIRDMYDEGLVQHHLSETAIERIKTRRIERLKKQRNVALYAFLVGINNAVRSLRFIEMAQDGNAIPPDFVKAYMPIIEMIDDIVDAGPGAIQQLKLVHQRAKRSKK